MKKIEGTQYAIEEDGTVWRVEGKPWGNRVPPYKMEWNDNGNGYKNVGLNGKTCYIHRLVAQQFIPNPHGYKYVGHKDHNKENNHVDNLYWTDASRNTKDGVKDGRINYKGRYNGPMQHHSDEVLTEAYKEAKMGAEVQTTANKYGVNRTTLSSWLNKRSRVKLTDEIDKSLDTNQNTM